jgi:pimeloyl-ACP methyl ester carboxylesterase
MQGNYGPALNWYRAQSWNLNEEDERHSQPDPKLVQPVLMLKEKPSAVGVPGFAEQIRQFADNVTIKELSTTGHWMQLEAWEEVNQLLEGFFGTVCESVGNEAA